MGRILALDIGDVRIGIASSDLLKMIANPVESYTRISLEKDVARISQIVKEKEVEKIVSGIPLSLSGQENVQSQKTREFVEELKKVVDVPIVFQDERFTSVSAENVLIEGNVKRRDRKKVIDKVAATIILQNYLDYRK